MMRACRLLYRRQVAMFPNADALVSAFPFAERGKHVKFLLLLALLAVVWWLWRKNARSSEVPPPAAAREAETMVACVHCGVLLPQSEALVEGARFYCCQEHRAAGSKVQ